MSAAVAERPPVTTGAAPATRPTTIVFMARRSELKLVVKAERKRHNNEGEAVETIPGQRIAFRDGVLRIPAEETMRGEKGEQLKTADVLAFLRAHPMYDDKLEGFWELQEPAPPATADELSRLTALTAELDVEGIEAFIKAEESGWRRETLLTPARTSLDAARRLRAEREGPRDEPTSESAKAAAKPAPRK